MDLFEGMPKQFTVSFEPDDDGYIGRECPRTDCVCKYFKITPETGVSEDDQTRCPYCGHVADDNDFITVEQNEYIETIAVNMVTEALIRNLGDAISVRAHIADRFFDLSVSLKVTGEPYPVYQYQEKELETEVGCDQCGLRFAIYGVFAFCPDCGAHNSLQILDANLAVAEKKLVLAGSVDPELVEYIVADALQTVVSAFDAFGRETCRVYADCATSSDAARSLSFQSVSTARLRVQELFGFDFAESVAETEWDSVYRTLQKRHLFAHRGGVVDQAYLSATHDPAARLGRKVPLSTEEVLAAVAGLRCLGRALVGGITGQAPGANQSGANGEM